MTKINHSSKAHTAPFIGDPPLNEPEPHRKSNAIESTILATLAEKRKLKLSEPDVSASPPVFNSKNSDIGVPIAYSIFNPKENVAEKPIDINRRAPKSISKNNPKSILTPPRTDPTPSFKKIHSVSNNLNNKDGVKSLSHTPTILNAPQIEPAPPLKEATAHHIDLPNKTIEKKLPYSWELPVGQRAAEFIKPQNWTETGTNVLKLFDLKKASGNDAFLRGFVGFNTPIGWRAIRSFVYGGLNKLGIRLPFIKQTESTLQDNAAKRDWSDINLSCGIQYNANWMWIQKIALPGIITGLKWFGQSDKAAKYEALNSKLKEAGAIQQYVAGGKKGIRNFLVGDKVYGTITFSINPFATNKWDIQFNVFASPNALAKPNPMSWSHFGAAYGLNFSTRAGELRALFSPYVSVVNNAIDPISKRIPKLSGPLFLFWNVQKSPVLWKAYGTENSEKMPPQQQVANPIDPLNNKPLSTNVRRF